MCVDCRDEFVGMGGDTVPRITDKRQAKGDGERGYRGFGRGPRYSRADGRLTRNGARVCRGGADGNQGYSGGGSTIGTEEEEIGEGWGDETSKEEYDY